MNYDINYEDQKFKNVESEKQAALTESNNAYDQMINSSDQYYQDQINAAKDYATTQQQIQQANTDFAIEQINQQKDQAQKDYTKEQSGAYVDWQKQSNQYGANAEQMAANGLTNTGYSESSQVSMYNTYQNRVSTARESYNKAVLNYDNAIKDAQLQNNSALAEIAYNALQTQLELSLQGFQYKNQLVLDKLSAKQTIDNTYYSRYQDVLQQMNTENAMKEQIRQYEQDYAEQVRQYNQNYAQSVKEYEEGIRQFDTQMAYYKQKDAQEYALKIKQLEEEKRQFQQEYALKQQQMAQDQAQWQAEFNLAKQSASAGGGSGGGGGGSYIVDKTGTGQIQTKYYSGPIAENVGGYGYMGSDNNGVAYQPKGVKINGKAYQLSKSGLTISNNGVTQNVWQAKAGNTTYYYYWEGRENKYKSINANTVKGLQKIKNASGGGSR